MIAIAGALAYDEGFTARALKADGNLSFARLDTERFDKK
jgi:hypothetical protein